MPGDIEAGPQEGTLEDASANQIEGLVARYSLNAPRAGLRFSGASARYPQTLRM